MASDRLVVDASFALDVAKRMAIPVAIRDGGMGPAQSESMDSAHQRVSLAPGVTTPWLDALLAHAPHAEVLRWHGSGHFPMLERPEEVNRSIGNFLQRHALSG